MPRRKQRTNGNGTALHGHLTAVRADLDALHRDVLHLMTDGATTLSEKISSTCLR